jgi:hypothetical protein
LLRPKQWGVAHVTRPGCKPQHGVEARLVLLSVCLFVIAAVLILPQVDLLDAAGTEVTAVVSVKCHFGTPSNMRLDAPVQTNEGAPISRPEIHESQSALVANELFSSQDFLCRLRC